MMRKKQLRNRDKFYNQPNQKRVSSRDYIDNKRFYQEIVEHNKKVAEAKKAGLEEPRLSEYIGKCIWLIAERFGRKPRFMNYSFLDEMRSDAIENCFMYFSNFDPDKYDNPFAYFTQITRFAFLRRINKEEKNRFIIYKSFQESHMNMDQGLMVDYDDKVVTTPQIYDNINLFIQNFEEREEVKKQKRKEAKLGLEKFVEEKDERKG